MDAALELVLEIGPSNLTFARLAERVSMVPASIVHRFGSRENLIAEISNEVTRRFDRLSKDAETANGTVGSIVNFLVDLCRPNASPASIINQIALLQIELAVPMLRADVSRRSHAVRSALTCMCKRAVESGELSCEDIDALSAALHDAQVGALLNWCVNPQGELRERVALGRKLINGIPNRD